MSTVVHLGFHKTGTTALQREFFPKLEGCRLLTHGGRTSRSVFRMLCDNLLHDDDPDFYVDTMRTFLREAEDAARGVVIVSHEGLSGDVFRGAYNSERNAVRLQRVLPDAKVLMVVRHQAAMLRSLYSQHVRHGGFDSFHEFVTNARPGSDVIDLDHLCYHRAIERYQALFGRDRVQVMAYEQLERDPPVFLKDLATFVGADPDDYQLRLDTVNRSLSPASRWVLRHHNRLFWKTRLNPKPGLVGWRRAQQFSTAMHDHIDRRVFPNAPRTLARPDEALLQDLATRYRESNARVVALTGLPLRAMGYPMPSGST